MIKPEAPAWVQAIGSIAAIGVAIWVPAWQRRKDRLAKECEQSLQATAIAGALQPFVHAYRRRAQYLSSQIVLAKEVVGLRSEIPEDAFDLPPTVQQFHTYFYLLGEDADIANKFVASLFWLQQAAKTIHRGHLFENTQKQIEVDCANTICFAQALSKRLEVRCGNIGRKRDDFGQEGERGD
jgi:hypothetical protein